MDNSYYYTGATLVRSSTNQASANTPLNNQNSASNLLTGVPLIRSGNNSGISAVSHTQPGQPPPPSSAPPGSIICCFQPIYYIPQPQPTYPHFSNTFQQQSIQQSKPKRKNYKSLTNPPNHHSINKNRTNTSHHSHFHEYYKHEEHPDTSHHHSMNHHHARLVASVSFPEPQQQNTLEDTSTVSHPPLKRTISHPPKKFWEDSPEIVDDTNDGNQLLDFYFLEKHWRPKPSPTEKKNENWEISKQHSPIMHEKMESSTVNGNGLSGNSGAKDLEVEAEIVTLANGHRDLEIRLCYVTS